MSSTNSSTNSSTKFVNGVAVVETTREEIQSIFPDEDYYEDIPQDEEELKAKKAFYKLFFSDMFSNN